MTEEEIKQLKEIVNQQAKDEGLWFIPKYVTEDMLQKALRRLHAIIEGDKRMEKLTKPKGE